MTKLNIPRLPGESQEDFRRRYGREKKRIYDARKPKAPRKPKGRNKAPEKNSLLTQEQWEALQPQHGESEADWKKRSGRERMRIWRGRPENAGKCAARARAAYHADIDASRARQNAYRAANPEMIAAADLKYFEAHRDGRLEKLTRWGKDNPDKLKAAKQAWNAENRALLAHYSAKWRKQARIATPAWVDWEAIRAVYEAATRISEQTGIPHEVDHMVPLQSQVVCGLHVHTNMRIITASENCKKRNRLIPELVDTFNPEET